MLATVGSPEGAKPYSFLGSFHHNHISYFHVEVEDACFWILLFSELG